jgi:hypothetical protein
MDRRQALQRAGLVLGYAISAPVIAGIMNGCKSTPELTYKPVFFTEEQAGLVSEVAAIIIPKTDTPGAKEVACGRGFFGRELTKLGADVTFTDARQLFVDALIADGYNALLMDQDHDWTVPPTFDLVIHFGVLYHLDDWKKDLQFAIKTAPIVLLESEVVDSLDPTYEKKVQEIDNYDQAFNRTATKFSDLHVEAYLKELRVRVENHSDASIDCRPDFIYDWVHGEHEGVNFHKNTLRRRMWLIRKNA